MYGLLAEAFRMFVATIIQDLIAKTKLRDESGRKNETGGNREKKKKRGELIRTITREVPLTLGKRMLPSS
jgi:hypothetical protein